MGDKWKEPCVFRKEDSICMMRPIFALFKGMKE